MMDFRTWFKGHGADNDLKFEVERLRRENTELETQCANLQLFYDDQSDQMTELKKELAQYKTSMNSFFNDSGDVLTQLKEANEKIEQLTQELELLEYDKSKGAIRVPPDNYKSPLPRVLIPLDKPDKKKKKKND